MNRNKSKYKYKSRIRTLLKTLLRVRFYCRRILKVGQGILGNVCMMFQEENWRQGRDLKRWRAILEVEIPIQITTGEDLDSFPNLILVLIYFFSLFFIVAFLYWCYGHKVDNLNKLCATMKQEQLYWQIFTISHITT